MKRWLLALGIVFGGLYFWKRARAGGPTVTFTVVLENLSGGATTWTAWWWDGAKYVPSVLGPGRPVSEAVMFKDVGFGPGSYVMVEVIFEGLPYRGEAMLPNPVNFAGYAFDWQTKTLRLL